MAPFQGTVCQFWMVMLHVTFLSLCSAVQIHYFKNGPNVTVTFQIISKPNSMPCFTLESNNSRKCDF